MDNRERQSRIERMKREKRRQERLRRRRLAIMKRCLAVGIAVALILLVIAGVWALVKPFVKRNATRASQTEGQEEIKNEENTGAIDPNDAPNDNEPLPLVTVTPAIDESPVVTPEVVGTEQSVANDGLAEQKPIASDKVLSYAVPGWQVDDRGWWYANANDTYYENGWMTFGEDKYYFDSEGYMQTGWAPIGGKGYFFSESGQHQEDKVPKMIAVTFDDGPGRYTEHLLDILDANNAKATFFMLGQCISDEFGHLVQRMKEDGHELANHTYTHTNLTSLNGEDIREEFARTDERISEVTSGSIATLARTPFGAQDSYVLGNINKPVIYWDIDTKDWQTKSVEKNIEAAMKATDGSIILMHDIHEATVKSCETIIPKLIEEGYELVTVTELARAHGVEMEAGVTYFAFTAEKLAELRAAEAAVNPTEDAEASE